MIIAHCSWKSGIYGGEKPRGDDTRPPSISAHPSSCSRPYPPNNKHRLDHPTLPQTQPKNSASRPRTLCKTSVSIIYWTNPPRKMLPPLLRGISTSPALLRTLMTSFSTLRPRCRRRNWEKNIPHRLPCPPPAGSHLPTSNYAYSRVRYPACSIAASAYPLNRFLDTGWR